MKQWAVLIGVSAVILAAILLAMSRSRTGSASESDFREPSQDQLEHLTELSGALRTGDFEVGDRLYRALDYSPRSFSPQVYDDLLFELQVGQEKTGFQRDGILLYGYILADVARLGIPIERIQFHAQRLRHHSLTLEQKESLYFPAASSFMEYRGLLDYAPELLEDVVNYYVLFGEREDYWSRATQLIPRLLTQRRREKGLSQERRLYPMRTLARIAGSSQLEEARELLREVLGKLGDGSRADIDRFNRWYAEVLENKRQEPWLGIRDTSEYYRYSGEEAQQIRFWLAGVYRFYLPDRGVDRGSQLIEIALEGPITARSHLFELDLARALRAEANRTEGLLVDETYVLKKDRIRQLYDVAWGAIRLRDTETLEAVIDRLSEYQQDSEVTNINGILRGAFEVLTGDASDGRRRIAELSQLPYQILTSAEIEKWRLIGEGEYFEGAHPDEVGRILLEMGVLWEDMRDNKRLAEVVNRLRMSQAREEDLYYYRYLRAHLDYRLNRIDGLSDEIKSLLDQEEPPGVYRSDVAGLAYAVDLRAEDLDKIDERRQQAVSDLLPRVASRVTDDSVTFSMAKVLAWQIEMDRTRGQFLHTEEGQQSFERMMDRLDKGGPLGFELEEKWLELREEIIQLAERYRA